MDDDTDRVALTRSLQPRPSDYLTVFESSAAEQLRDAYEAKLWSAPPVITPNPGQTDVLVFHADGGMFGTDAPWAKDFPGGYAKLKGIAREGVSWVAWKFVKPDETIGMAYDGLVQMDTDRWAWFPKPWRII
jgi:hypothetical protein